MYDKKDKKIIFSMDTKWELYDAFGNLLKIGHSEAIDVSDLKRGAYYLNFGNVTEKLLVK